MDNNVFGKQNKINIGFAVLGILKKDDPFLDFLNCVGSPISSLKKLKVMTETGTVFEIEVGLQGSSTNCCIDRTELSLELLVMSVKKSEF